MKEIGDVVPADLHFHDLRHSGNHVAPSSGASTRELMGPLGHASMRAALIYQHRTMTWDRAIAEALDALIEQRHMILGSLGTDRDQTSLFDYPAECRERSLTRGKRCGAGDENRTRMASLEGRARGAYERVSSLRSLPGRHRE